MRGFLGFVLLLLMIGLTSGVLILDTCRDATIAARAGFPQQEKLLEIAKRLKQAPFTEEVLSTLQAQFPEVRFRALSDTASPAEQEAVIGILSLTDSHQQPLTLVMGPPIENAPISLATVFWNDPVAHRSMTYLGIFLLVAIAIGFTSNFGPYRRMRVLLNDATELRVSPATANLEKDDIGYLGQVFKNVKRRFDHSEQRLINTDELQREFISNISHDLRSPLTTAQGFLETVLIRGDRLSSEERERYLEIAFENIKSFTKQWNHSLPITARPETQYKPPGRNNF